MRPVGDTLLTLGQDRHREWQRLITRAGLEGLLPSDYTEAIRQLTHLDLDAGADELKHEALLARPRSTGK